MADHRAEALSEFSQAIAREILTMPVLSDPEWDTYALAADVSDEATKLTAYRYPEAGPAVPTPYPMAFDLFADLRERTQGDDGQKWDVAIVRIHRDTAQLVVNFVAGDAAAMWRISPENIDNLPELLRPRPEDFAA
jgi:hypothetical protein